LGASHHLARHRLGRVFRLRTEEQQGTEGADSGWKAVAHALSKFGLKFTSPSVRRRAFPLTSNSL
jgi:hypothetical protein